MIIMKETAQAVAVSGDRAAVMTYVYAWNTVAGENGEWSSETVSQTHVKLYDVQDKAAPVAVADFVQDGSSGGGLSGKRHALSADGRLCHQSGRAGLCQLYPYLRRRRPDCAAAGGKDPGERPGRCTGVYRPQRHLDAERHRHGYAGGDRADAAVLCRGRQALFGRLVLCDAAVGAIQRKISTR